MILIPSSGSFKWVWVKWLIRIFLCLRWYSLKHQVLPHAAGLELDDSFLESWVGSLIEGFSLTLWGWRFQHWVFPTAASWTQWTHADPENLYAGFPGGTGVHQNWTIFYLWTLKCQLCHCFVEKLAPVSLWGGFILRTAFLCCWRESAPCYLVSP